MGSTVTSARVVGALLVERGLVSPAQLAEALEHQRANGGELDDVLQYLFAVHPDRVAEVVGAYQRREISVDIGSLLLAAGAVDEERLAEARRRSADTGQPVGPILVEMGAITRLELASALADQWSDSPAQIVPPPGLGDRAEAGSPFDDIDSLRFAMRALEASLRSDRADDGAAEGLDELRRREEQLAARVSALEVAIEQPVEVDPALVEEIHATAERLAAVQAALEHVARVEDVTALAGSLAEVEALRATVVDLATRTVDLPSSDDLQRDRQQIADLADRLDETASALGGLVSAEELQVLRAAVGDLAARPAGDPGLDERVAELGRSVEALAVLAEASSGAEGLQEALEGIAGQVEAALTAAAAAQAGVDGLRAPLEGIASLGARVDLVEGADAEQAAQLVALRTDVAALEAVRSQVDEAAAAAAHVGEELARLGRDVAGLGALAERVEGLETAVARSGVLEGALQSLAGEVAELGRRPEGDPALATRLDALVDQVASLAARVEPVGALSAAVEEAAARIAAVEAVADDVAGLREAIGRLETRPDADTELGPRLDQLADRVERLAIDALGPAAEAAVAGVAARVDELAGAQTAALERSDELSTRLEELAVAVAGLREAHAGRSDVDPRIDALDAALAELELRLDGTAPAAAVASLLGAVDELQALVGPLAGVGGRVEHLERRVADAESHAADAAHTTAEAILAVREQLDSMTLRTEEQVGALLERLTEVERSVPASVEADPALHADVAALGEAVEAVRATLATELARVERAWVSEREALEEQIAAMAGAASAAPESSGEASSASTPAPELAKLARDLERLSDRVVEQERSLVEHFARRERALVERLGAGTDVGARLAELTRRIEEVRVRAERSGAAGGSGGAVSDAEIDELKDSLFGRLERLASSIDWRFQRLEGGPAAAAGRSELQSRVDELARAVEQLAGGNGNGSSSTAVDAGGVFLTLVPTDTGHQLVELGGAMPQAGDVLANPLGEGDLLVVAVGTSPLPGDERPCAFVEPVAELAPVPVSVADAGTAG